MGYQFITSLDNKKKVNLVQVYLRADKSTIIYIEAKKIVGKMYQQFNKPSFLNQFYNQLVFSSFILVKSKLVVFLQALKILQSAIPPKNNIKYGPNHFNANYRV